MEGLLIDADARRGPEKELRLLEVPERIAHDAVRSLVRDEDHRHRMAHLRIRLVDARDADVAETEEGRDAPEHSRRIQHGHADVVPELDLLDRDELGLLPGVRVHEAGIPPRGAE